MPSLVLPFCPLSTLPSIYIILGHLFGRSYWLKDADCLRSCISSWLVFPNLHGMWRASIFAPQCSFTQIPGLSSSWIFFFLCPPILLNGCLVKSCLYRLTALEVLEKKPDPCTYTLTNRIKISRHKWNISLCFAVWSCQYHVDKLTEEHLQQVNLFFLVLVSHIYVWLWI